jgi:hypothetical protein
MDRHIDTHIYRASTSPNLETTSSLIQSNNIHPTILFTKDFLVYLQQQNLHTP